MFITLIVLSVLLEDLRVMGVILFIRHPSFVFLIFSVIIVLNIEIHGSYVILVSSVLNVFHIRMSQRNTVFRNNTFSLLLNILSLLHLEMVSVLEDFLLSLLSHLVINLGKLLHVEHVLVDEVLLVLADISKVLGRASGKYLAAFHHSSLLYYSSGGYDRIGFNCDSWLNPGVDSDISERLHCALIQFRSRSDVRVLSNCDRFSI